MSARFTTLLSMAGVFALAICLGCSRPAGGGDLQETSGARRVIVSLRVPEYDTLLKASQRGGAKADAALSAAVRATAERVAAEVVATAGEAHVAMLEVFRFTPSAVFRVDAAGMEALRRHPDVVSVQEDKGRKLQ